MQAACIGKQLDRIVKFHTRHAAGRQFVAQHHHHHEPSYLAKRLLSVCLQALACTALQAVTALPDSLWSALASKVCIAERF